MGTNNTNLLIVLNYYIVKVIIFKHLKYNYYIMTPLEIVLIIIVCILVIVLSLFATWFLAYKSTLRKEIHIKTKYNELMSTVGGISFTKLKLLAENNPRLLTNLELLQNSIKQIQNNMETLRANIKTLSIEVAKINYFGSRKIINAIEEDLELVESQYNEFTKGYKDCSEYSDTIALVFNSYRDIFKIITDFYHKEILINFKFEKIEKILENTALNLTKLNELSVNFDFNITLHVLKKLRSDMSLAYKTLEQVYILKTVRSFLITAEKKVNQLLTETYNDINSQDFEKLEKLLTVYREYKTRFARNFADLKIKDAFISAVEAIKIFDQINTFVQLNINANKIIDDAQNIIKIQFNQLIDSKTQLINNLKDLKQYFNTNQTMSRMIADVTNSLDYINQSFDESLDLEKSSYSKKKESLIMIHSKSKMIIEEKNKIMNDLNEINSRLQQTLNFLIEFNNLSIALNYLRTLVEKLKRDEKQEQHKTQIDTLLKNVEIFIKKIIETDTWSFTDANKLISDTSQEMLVILNSIANMNTLKQYATKFMMYVNKFAKQPSVKDYWLQANDFYNSQDYKECINFLIKATRKTKN